MTIVQGIGGVFLYADDAAALAAWYTEHLGLTFTNYGKSHFLELPSADVEPGPRTATTVFALFQADEALPAGVRTGRVNFRIGDLDGLLDSLRSRGVAIEPSEDESYGRFAWIRDPEGNRVELWEPRRPG